MTKTIIILFEWWYFDSPLLPHYYKKNSSHCSQLGFSICWVWVIWLEYFDVRVFQWSIWKVLFHNKKYELLIENICMGNIIQKNGTMFWKMSDEQRIIQLISIQQNNLQNMCTAGYNGHHYPDRLFLPSWPAS